MSEAKTAYLTGGQEPATSRISMLDPGIISPGLSRATSSARS
jgi:hypothetical protein